MSAVTRLPTKFGQGHSDAIAFVQEEVLARVIDNKLVTLVVCALIADGDEDGDELRFIMTDGSGSRVWNQRTIALLTEVQQAILTDMQEASP